MWGSEKHILDEPLLVQAIFLNDPAQLENALLSSPLPDGPNFADEQRRTLLHAAAFCGNVNITNMLIKKGARVNTKDVFWVTPLHRVCCREETHPEEEDESKPDLMMGLEIEKLFDRPVFSSHIRKSRSTDQLNNFNFEQNNPERDTNWNEQSLEWILANHLNIGQVPYDAQNPLLNGLLTQPSTDNADISRTDLFSQPSSPKNENSIGLVRCNSQSFQGGHQPPSHMSTAFNQGSADLEDDQEWPNFGETCRILLEAGADISARDKLWQTPLHVAAANNALTCAEMILAHQERKAQSATHKFNFLDISDKFGRTCLHHAVFSGHVRMAQLLLEHGASPDILDKRQRRPAHYAAFLGFDEMLGVLAKHGAQFEVFDQHRLTPLHAACAGGRVSAVQSLLSMRARLDVTDAQGNTGLHICSLNGKSDVAHCLIMAGAAVSAKNAMGYTPLHYAAASTHGGVCVELLLSLGALVNAKSGLGRTPLHMSAIHGRLTRAQNLISAGAQINIADRYGLTTLHIAARYGHELLVQCLINEGANVNYTSRDGSSALHLAALYGHLAVCLKLLAAGADVLGRDNQGRTPIHCSAFAGNLELTTILIEEFSNYVDVQTKKRGLSFDVIVDSNGRTPLHYAVSNRNQHRDVNLLAYLNQKFPLDAGRHDVDGRTPLHLACSLEDDLYVNYFLGLLKADEWCKLLDNTGAGPLHYAAYAGNCHALQAILSQLSSGDIRAILGSPPNSPTQRLSPIELSARGGHLQCLQLLLNYVTNESDGSHESVSQGRRSDLSLILAAKHNREDCVEFLLESSLYDVNLKDQRGRSSLMYASMKSSGNTIKALLDQDADVNVRDHRGLGVLHYAFNNYEATRELLEKGAPLLNYLKVPCKSPLHLAALSGNSKVITLLLETLEVGLEHLMTASQGSAASDAQGRRSIMSLRDPQGYTPLHYACYSGNRECVALLLKNVEDEGGNDEIEVTPKAQFTELHCAAGHVNGGSLIESILKLFGRQCIHAKDSQGRTSLHVAAIRGVQRNCDALILQKANVDDRDSQGCTPLMLAAQYGQCNVIELLVRHGADVCAQDIEGNSSLHKACINHQEAVVQLLLEKLRLVQLVNLTNQEGRTALHIAARNGLVTATQLLILRGANVLAQDKFGHTPALCCATNAQVARCLKLILDVSPMAFPGGAVCPDMPSPPLSEEEEDNFTR